MGDRPDIVDADARQRHKVHNKLYNFDKYKEHRADLGNEGRTYGAGKVYLVQPDMYRRQRILKENVQKMHLSFYKKIRLHAQYPQDGSTVLYNQSFPYLGGARGGANEDVLGAVDPSTGLGALEMSLDDKNIRYYAHPLQTQCSGDCPNGNVAECCTIVRSPYLYVHPRSLKYMESDATLDIEGEFRPFDKHAVASVAAGSVSNEVIYQYDQATSSEETYSNFMMLKNDEPLNVNVASFLGKGFGNQLSTTGVSGAGL
jgi:hypothetical protein